jgi:hypothetical protein
MRPPVTIFVATPAAQNVPRMDTWGSLTPLVAAGTISTLGELF